MATRSRRASGSRTSATPTASSAEASGTSLVAKAVNAPAAGLHNAWEAWLQLGKAELAAQIDAAQSLLKGAHLLREAQLEANEKAQTAHAQAAEQVTTLHNLNDVAGVHLTLLRDDLQGAVGYWSRIGEVSTTASLDSWARSTETLSRLQTSFWNSALQWTQLAQMDAPAATEELEATVDHMVNPLIASPMMWPSQEAAREVMTLASSALNDWFSWSGLRTDGAAGPASAVH